MSTSSRITAPTAPPRSSAPSAGPTSTSATTRRGKGYALQDLLSRMETAGSVYDAYVIVDADAVVDAHYLDHLAAAILRGARALQGQNTVLNTLDAPSTVLRWLALTLMNHVRP